MPVGKTFTRQEVGSPVSARGINEPQETLEELSRAIYLGDLNSSDVGGARNVRSRVITKRIAMSPSGGIPARSGTTPGSATVVTYVFDGTTLYAGNSVTAYNLSGTAVGDSKYIMICRVQDFWFVDFEDCT